MRYEGNTATLNWWQSEAGENYQLSLGIYGSNPDSGLMTTTVDTFHTVTDLQPDVIYQAWVRKACHYTTAGYDTIVWSDWSQPATFRIGVGISDVEGDAAFTLAPNPTHGTVVLTLAETAEGAELTLCDLGGRELRRVQVTGTTLSLDVSALPSGVYLLKLTTPQGVAIRRLLVE
ncbi:MAG: T9SS type A sorting domain-containing protein [Bacteroidales bacterium]|nr:T9SS type A sorting domain-containing protein [Bacteroidales bacterium]